MLSSVVCSAVKHFLTLSHKRHDFRKKKLVSIKYIFQVSLGLLPETYFIRGRTERDMIENVYWSSRKVLVILLRF